MTFLYGIFPPQISFRNPLFSKSSAKRLSKISAGLRRMLVSVWRPISTANAPVQIRQRHLSA